MPTITVLFVCVHNSGRSQMAQAFFNHLAGGKAVAISAGTQPAAHLNPTVVEAMREVGIDISDRSPMLLTPDLLDQADEVIAMGCGESVVCPATMNQGEDWALEDPAAQPIEKVRRIRDEIRDRVEKLLAKANE